MSGGRYLCLISRRRQLKFTAKKLNQRNIPSWKTYFEDLDHRPSYVWLTSRLLFFVTIATMFPLKLLNAFEPFMTQKQKALGHAVCMRTCTSHAGHFHAAFVVAAVSFV